MTSAPPRPDVAERLCKGCGNVKSLRKGARLCSDCKPDQGGKASKKSKTRRAAIVTPGPRLALPSGLGIEVDLAVDESNGQTDIHLLQHNATLNDQNIWLSQSEAAALHAWLGEHMGLA